VSPFLIARGTNDKAPLVAGGAFGFVSSADRQRTRAPFGLPGQVVVVVVVVMSARQFMAVP
jgi:hypothetical protein